MLEPFTSAGESFSPWMIISASLEVVLAASRSISARYFSNNWATLSRLSSSLALGEQSRFSSRRRSDSFPFAARLKHLVLQALHQHTILSTLISVTDQATCRSQEGRNSIEEVLQRRKKAKASSFDGRVVRFFLLSPMFSFFSVGISFLLLNRSNRGMAGHELVSLFGLLCGARSRYVDKERGEEEALFQFSDLRSGNTLPFGSGNFR